MTSILRNITGSTPGTLDIQTVQTQSLSITNQYTFPSLDSSVSGYGLISDGMGHIDWGPVGVGTGSYLPLAGGTLSGPLSMGTNSLSCGAVTSSMLTVGAGGIASSTATVYIDDSKQLQCGAIDSNDLINCSGLHSAGAIDAFTFPITGGAFSASSLYSSGTVSILGSTTTRGLNNGTYAMTTGAFTCSTLTW